MTLQSTLKTSKGKSKIRTVERICDTAKRNKRHISCVKVQNINYYILFALHGFVQCLSLNQKHRNLLLYFHMQTFIKFLYFKIERLAFMSIHNSRIKTLKTQLSTVIKQQILCVRWLHWLENFISIDERKKTKNNDSECLLDGNNTW